MIDLSLINELEPELQAAVKNAILTLVNSGIVDTQLSVSFESIASGSVSEEPSELAAKILRYRQESNGLIALKGLAGELKESNS